MIASVFGLKYATRSTENSLGEDPEDPLKNKLCHTRRIAMSWRVVIPICLAVYFTIGLSAHAEQVSGSNNPASDPQAPTESVEIPKPEEIKGQGEPILQVRNPRYRLRYGDVIELKFPLTPEFDQKVTIQPDGYIGLVGLDDFHIEGKTKSELAQMLREAYRKVLRDPEIVITLLEFEKPYFVAGGEIEKPGKYDMRGDTTVAQAVNIAGGLTVDAKHSQVLLFRNVSDEWVKVIKVDLKKVFGEGQVDEDLHLQPGDMVFVPKSMMGKIKPYLPRPDLWLWMGINKSGGRN